MSAYSNANGPPLDVIEIPIADLGPYPRQANVFKDLSDAELRSLANDIAVNGQREPIDVLPDMTIITGHQRVRAIKLLGRETIRAIVRHDLSGKPGEVYQLFLRDNLNRRHLGPLAIARCYRELRQTVQSECQSDRSVKIGSLRATVIEQLASVDFRISDRTLSRYVELLDLPRSIQDAIEGKRLTKRNGRSILEMSNAHQQEIADACAAGATKKDLSQLLVTLKGGVKSRAHRRVAESVGVLAAIGKPGGPLSEIATRYSADNGFVDRLEKANETVKELLKEIYEIRRSSTVKDKLSRSRSPRSRGA
jgi:ParB/RepB/Spo0J family partition protein